MSGNEKTPWNPSRRATARVPDPLPAPTVCPHCGGEVDIAHHDEIYGTAYGEWPWAYRCKTCGAHVGMHPYTAIPLGTLATDALRKARMQAKQPFETWRKTRRIDRSQAYATLAQRMGIPVEKCHFGWFDLEACKQAQQAAVALLRTTPQPQEGERV